MDIFVKGKMLLAESEPTFNDTLKGAFTAFKPRIVDMALKKALFTVIGDTAWDDEESCGEYGGYGAQWIDDLCLNMYECDIPFSEYLLMVGR
jgi:hypothetical protein